MSDPIEKIAKVCHEVNRLYCQSHGDTSQPAWDDAPDWQKKSARVGVLHLLTNRKATPEQTHESWLCEKKADGWVYGPVKNAEFKTHPCMVPYEELPQQQRIKDSLFQAVVRGMS
ncbi:RyR domain-containing protein [Phaeobacter gallaeciensis]|uniref:RyR domain-containing protein n=1 Tax=Phaeobacter gallaeciensis TaxID=60890 RepID=UPI00238098E5|nr:RyR domain-containing protein [Phaeobacter gallaeciensis]MDE4297113.1 RyR domain-containing protein [Phaeobacter gallaeciensis]